MVANTNAARGSFRTWLGEHWKTVVVVWVLSLLPFLSVIFGGQALFASDQMGAPGSWRWYFEALRGGSFPLWNPYSFGGMPTFDAMFGDSAYPTFILLGFILPVTYVVTYNFLLHVLIAGFTSYFLVQRYFGLNRWLAAPLALAWALNPHFISYIYGGHTGKFHIMAWLPLGVFFLLRALGTTTSWKHLLGLALTTALFVLTTHLQFTYFVMMGYFVVWLYFIIPEIKAKRFGESGMMVLKFWAPLMLGVGLAFFIFYPPVQYNKEFSVRGEAERTTYEHATSWSINPEEAASLLVPEFSGLNVNYWGRNFFKMNTEAPGTLVWFLGLFALIAFRRSRWAWLWATVGLLSLIFALGANTPLFRLFYEFVPGVKNFRAPSMMLFWLSMALLLLAAETLRRLTAEGSDRIADAARTKLAQTLSRVGWVTVSVLALAALMPGVVYAVWGIFVDESQIRNLARQEMAGQALTMGLFRIAALVGLLTFALGTFVLKARRPLAFGLAALAVVVVDSYWLNSNFIEGYDPERTVAVEPAVGYLKGDKERFRVFGVPGTFERWQLQYHGLESADGFIDHELALYRAYRGNDYQQNPNLFRTLVQKSDGTVSGSPFLDLLNVKYLAYRLPNDPGLKLALNSSYMPRAFFASRWEAVRDTQALAVMRQPGFDPRRLALIQGEGVVSGGVLADSAAPLIAAREVSRTPNRLQYSVDAPVEGYLIVTDVWFPHWKATVNGREVPIERAYHAFRAVKVAPGRNEVEFTYHSPWIRLGFMVAGASAVGLAILCVAFATLSRRRRASGTV